MMSEPRRHLGTGALALIPVACCIGVPLLVAAGTSAAVLVWGGAVIGGIVIATLAGVLLIRRRARGAARRRHLVEFASSRERASETREEVVRK